MNVFCDFFPWPLFALLPFTHLNNVAMQLIIDKPRVLLMDISTRAVAGAEQSEDVREMPRSPTLTSSGVAGSSHTERSSTSSDSAVTGICINTDHTVNDRHSCDEVTSRVSLPKGITAFGSFYAMVLCMHGICYGSCFPIYPSHS